MPGLDGVRAIAVCAVLAFHAGTSFGAGGFLGVDLFFTLSGFLITSLLLRELETTGRVDFRDFYVRRARRLLPALFATLGLVLLLSLTIAHDALLKTLMDLPAAVLFVANWGSVLSGQSYFASMGRPPFLQHLWSLAVEEQFYLVWPAVMLLLWKLGRRPLVAAGAFGLAVASTAWMAHLAIAGDVPFTTDSGRVYFGTDTHAMGVLVGAALAAVWRPQRMGGRLKPSARRTVDGVGVAALAIILVCFAWGSESSVFLYRGGFLAFALVAAVLVAAVTHPGGNIGPILGLQPFRWLGERSYGIYLYHWPIFLVTRPGPDLPVSGAALFVLRLAVTFAVAELSYRYLEQPIRRGAIGRFRARLPRSRRAQWRRRRATIIATSSASVVMLGSMFLAAHLSGIRERTDEAALAVQVPTTAPSASPNPSPSSSAAAPRPTASPTAAARPTPTAPPRATTRPTPKPTPAATPKPAASSTPTAPAAATGGIGSSSTRVFGDSLSIAAGPAITQKFPTTEVDAAVGRQMPAVMSEITAHRSELTDLVIVHTGNNGPIRASDARHMLESLKGAKRVVVVNQSLPRSWQDGNNRVWAEVVPEFDNARLADWYSASHGNRDLFGPDGVHPDIDGVQVYADMVERAARAK